MGEERAAGSWTAFPVAARCGCSAGCCALAAVVVAYQTAAVVAYQTAAVEYQTAAVVAAVVAY